MSISSLEANSTVLEAASEGLDVSPINSRDWIDGLPTQGNPFPGLRPFDVDDAEWFFGRDDEVFELLARLRRTRFLSVVGASGCGKSSLIRAGLIASLRSGVMVDEDSQWRIAIMRPGNNPIGQLAAALNDPQALGDENHEADEDIAVLQATLRRGSQGIIDAVRQARLPQNEKLLILVDQFEELFRFVSEEARQRANDEARAFVKLLIEAAETSDWPLHIAFTMRSDFLGHCAAFPLLPEAISNGLFLVPQMSRDQLREAIVEPVTLYQRRLLQNMEQDSVSPAPNGITDRLVNRLLNDLNKDVDHLPILQHALMRLWSKAAANTDETSEPLDLPCYEAIGGIEGALSQHAEEILGALASERSQQVAEGLFRAITDTTAEGQTVRRPVTFGEICEAVGAEPDELRSAIDAFRAPGRSFLMPPAGEALQGDTKIDISHEALIRQWGRLRDWASKEAREREVYKRIKAGATKWHESGQKSGYLFHDEQLVEAREWWQRHERELDDRAQEFLRAGDLHDKNKRDERRVAEAEARSQALKAGKSQLFLSYCPQDETFARQLCDELKKHGRAVWSGLDAPLSSAEEAINVRAKLESSDVVLVVLSPAATQAPLVQDVLKQASLLNKRLIPIISRKTDVHDLDPILSKWQSIDMYDKKRFSANFPIVLNLIDSDSDWVREHTRFLLKATEWDTRQRDHSLLLRGADLRQAEQWLEQDEQDKTPRPSPLQINYIIASQAARKRKGSQGRFVVTAMVAVLLSLLSMWAFLQSNVAKKNAKQAEAYATLAQENEHKAQASAILAGRNEKTARENAGKAERLRRHAEKQNKIILSERDEARKQRARASQQAAIALSERNEAQRQRVRAQEQARIALLERGRANQQARIALAQRNEALTQRRRAENQTQLALLRLKEVERLRGLAKQRALWAEHQRDVADWAKQQAFTSEAKAQTAAARAHKEAERANDEAERANDEAKRANAQAKRANDEATRANDEAKRANDEAKRAEALTQKLLLAQRKAGKNAVSLDGQYLAAASDNGQATLVSMETGKSIGEVAGSTSGEVTYVTFSPDSKMLITSGKHGVALLWEVPSLRRIGEFKGHSQSLRKAVFSPDKKILATISDDRTARTWDVASGRQFMKKPDREEKTEVLDIQFLSNGQIIRVSWANGMYGDFDPKTGRPPSTEESKPVVSNPSSSERSTVQASPNAQASSAVQRPPALPSRGKLP